MTKDLLDSISMLDTTTRLSINTRFGSKRGQTYYGGRRHFGNKEGSHVLLVHNSPVLFSSQSDPWCPTQCLLRFSQVPLGVNVCCLF